MLRFFDRLAARRELDGKIALMQHLIMYGGEYYMHTDAWMVHVQELMELCDRAYGRRRGHGR